MIAEATDNHPVAERIRLPIPGGDVAGLRWASQGAMQLVFLHATGFCASAYAPMLRLAQARFDVCALDLRGHGRTSLSAEPTELRSWDLYADDVRQALDRLPTPSMGRILAGHSCGAVVAALAAVGRTDIAGLALIEPVAMPGALSAAARTPFWPLISGRMPLVRKARTRRATFPSRAAAAENYAKKPLFARWAPGVLDGYLEDGLVETEAGMGLSCTPAWEAATFSAQAHDFWGAIRRTTTPFFVLVANNRTSTVSRQAARHMQRYGAQLTLKSGVSHLVPFEDPPGAAAFLDASSAAA